MAAVKDDDPDNASALVHESLQIRAVSAARREPRPIAQDHDIVALEQGLELRDRVGADNGRAVDADEAAGIEFRLEIGHGLAHQVRPLAGVQAGVVAFGADPGHLVGLEEDDLAAGLDGESFDIPRPGEALEEVGQALVERAVVIARDGLACAIDGRAETVLVERLEHVVEGVRVEGLDREVVVGRHEDDRRHGLGPDLGDDVEAAQLGHADVEEDEIRIVFADRIDGGPSVGTLGDDIDVRFLAQEVANPFARQGLVFGNHHSRSSRCPHSSGSSAPMGRNGMDMVTRNPPSARFLGSKLNRSRTIAAVWP